MFVHCWSADWIGPKIFQFTKFSVSPEVLYIPPAFVMVEKALLENNILYRAASGFVDVMSFDVLMKSKPWFPWTLREVKEWVK